jgi:putative hydrolase of the HAD superfamily
MASILDLPPSQFTELYWRSRIEYDAGLLDSSAYWNTLAESGTLTPEQIAELTEIDNRSWSHPAPVMPQWARDIRDAGVRTAILSNMPVTVRDYVLHRSWLPRFDALTFSCDLGVCKPELEIYHDCLKKLNAEPSEALFLDDREPNVRAAEALGLHAVLFTDVSKAAQEIDHRFSLPVTLSNLYEAMRPADRSS